MTILLFLLSNLVANSQNFTPTWSKFAGSTISTGGAVIRDFAVDQTGDIIAVGSFRGFSNFVDLTTSNLIFTQDGGKRCFCRKI